MLSIDYIEIGSIFHLKLPACSVFGNWHSRGVLRILEWWWFVVSRARGSSLSEAEELREFLGIVWIRVDLRVKGAWK